jgi:chromosome segregation ATPase
MKQLLLILFTGIVFFGCNEINNCNDIQSQLTNCNSKKSQIQTELTETKADLEVCKTGFNESIKDRDTLQLEKAQLQATITNLLSEIENLNDAHLVDVIELKQFYNDSISKLNSDLTLVLNHSIELEQQLSAKTDDYNALNELYNETIETQYLSPKSSVNQTLDEIQFNIDAKEQAYHNLQTIDPQQEAVLLAIQAVKKELYTLYGKRAVIGDIFPIQIETGVFDE